MTPLHHTKRAFFDQVPGKAPNGNAPFIFDFKELVVENIAAMLAIFMYEQYKGQLDILDRKIRAFLQSDDKGIESYCKSLFNASFDETLIENMIQAIYKHLDSVKNSVLAYNIV